MSPVFSNVLLIIICLLTLPVRTLENALQPFKAAASDGEEESNWYIALETVYGNGLHFLARDPVLNEAWQENGAQRSHRSSRS